MFVSFVVFLTSISIICYQIILIRIFAITQWHNLFSIIISLALLGFGVSGTFITLLKKQVERHFNSFILTFLFLYPVSLSLSFIIYCKIPFNPFEVGIDNRQILYLFAYFLIMGIPFTFSSAVICLALSRYPIGKTYFYNLFGSGLGAFLIILLLYILHPFDVLMVVNILSFIPVVIFSLNFKKIIPILITLASIIFATGFYFSFDFLNLKEISEYKSISRTLTLPGARILYERYSPLGLVQVAEAEGLRHIVGLSFACPYEIPVQKGIFFDGDSMSAITPFNGDTSKIGFLDYIPSALPYHLLGSDEKREALIIGTGGGEGILKALLNKFRHITAVEINKNVISLMKNECASFSGNIFNLPTVNVENVEARSFIKSVKKKFNLIEISVMDSFVSSASGIYALNESYLYTVESVNLLINCLDDGGLLAITRWNTTPPRDIIKMFNICVKALRKAKVTDPQRHIIFARSLQASTIVISKNPLSVEKIEKAKQFCTQRLFDMEYYYGIKPEDVNMHIKTPMPIYYLSAVNLLSEKPENFENEFLFDISCPTDNKPYFYNFFKLKTLSYIFQYGTREIPFTEWGYLILLIVLIPTTIFSFMLIILPLFFFRSGGRELTLHTVLYFSLVGIGFFFVEMPLIQKLILFLGNPTYSLGVIISTLLIFSGIGSYFSDKVFARGNRILFASIAITVFIILYLAFLDIILGIFIERSDMIKIVVTIILIMPTGFFMGFPFPLGLKMIKEIDDNWVPWAWSINGFFSVISVILANLLAIMFGFRLVLTLAAACYAAAGVLSVQWNRGDKNEVYSNAKNN